MLPSFSHDILFVQNHIHLGAVPNDGSTPTGWDSDGAPPYKFGHVQKRRPTYSSPSEFTRSWTGVPHDHVLRTSDLADPITFKDISYEIRVPMQDLDLLVALFKRRVYLIDNRHCEDGQDHTPYIRQMFFDGLSYEENLDPMLTYNIVSVTLMDMSTVAGL